MNSKNNIKAVFFDFGGTIMDAESDNLAHLHMIKEIKQNYSLPDTEEYLANLYHEKLFNNDMTLKNFNNIIFRRLYSFSENAFSSILNEYNINISMEDKVFFKHIYLKNHLKYIKLSDGAKETINSVKKRVYHCGIISDIDIDYQTKQFKALNINNIFHSITTSEEVKRYKPDPFIFETALKKAGCSGLESVIIGDSYSKDIAGGKNMNMYTIWINRYQKVIDNSVMADYTVKDLKEVIPVLEKILKI